jgi:hypothetical protein
VIFAVVQQMVSVFVDLVSVLLLARDGDAQAELLDARLATLRMCARELAGAAETA